MATGRAEGVRLGEGVCDGDAPCDSDDVGVGHGVRVDDGDDAGEGVLERERVADGVLETDERVGHVDASSTPNSAAAWELELHNDVVPELAHHVIAAPDAAATFPNTASTAEPSLQQKGPRDAKRDCTYQSDVGSSDHPYATMAAPGGHAMVVGTPAVEDPSLSSDTPDAATMLTECTRNGSKGPSKKLSAEPVSAMRAMLEMGGGMGAGRAGGG